MRTYPIPIEEQMRAFYHTLAEKDKRRYAGIEARKLGYGGITYIARVLGCSRETIHKGMTELDGLPEDESDRRQRRRGTGRKPYHQTHPDIDEQFLDVLRDFTAGDSNETDLSNSPPGQEGIKGWSIENVEKHQNVPIFCNVGNQPPLPPPRIGVGRTDCSVPPPSEPDVRFSRIRLSS